MKEKDHHWVYMLECENGAYYTGSTRDLVKRFREHVHGAGRCRYTRSFRPVRMARCWRVYGGRGDALKVEAFIKRQGRDVKKLLVRYPRRLMGMYNGTGKVSLKISSTQPIDIEKVNG